MNALGSRFFYIVAISLLALETPQVFAVGAIVFWSGAVAVGRSKTKARPDFFTLATASIDTKNELTIPDSFGTLQSACGRGAELQMRVEKKISADERGDDKKAAAIRAVLRPKVDGLCMSSFDFFLQPFPQKAGQFSSWAKALKGVMGADYSLLLTTPPLSDTSVPSSTISYKEAEHILDYAEGLTIYFHDTWYTKAEDFSALLKKNLIWANHFAVKHHKKISFYLPAFVDFGNKPIPAVRNLAESLRTVKTLTAAEAAGFCSDSVRVAVFILRLDDSKQDREVRDFEKWQTQICGAPPAQN